MRTWTASSILASLALAALPLGACSVESGQVTEQTAIDPALIPIGDVSAPNEEFTAVAVGEEDTVPDLEARRWWACALEYVSILATPEPLADDETYAVSFWWEAPTAEGDAQWSLEGDRTVELALLAIGSEEFSPCPDAEDPRPCDESFDVLGEATPCQTALDEEQFFTTPVQTQFGFLAGFEEALDESVFFDSTDAGTADLVTLLELADMGPSQSTISDIP